MLAIHFKDEGEHVGDIADDLFWFGYASCDLSIDGCLQTEHFWIWLL